MPFYFEKQVYAKVNHCFVNTFSVIPADHPTFKVELGKSYGIKVRTFDGRNFESALEKAKIDRAFVTMVLDCTHAPAHGGDSIIMDGKVIGTVTSADWGHRVGKNIAMGFIDPAFSKTETEVNVEVIGSPVLAHVVEDCLYDPQNLLVRV